MPARPARTRRPAGKRTPVVRGSAPTRSPSSRPVRRRCPRPPKCLQPMSMTARPHPVILGVSNLVPCHLHIVRAHAMPAHSKTRCQLERPPLPLPSSPHPLLLHCSFGAQCCAIPGRTAASKRTQTASVCVPAADPPLRTTTDRLCVCLLACSFGLAHRATPRPRRETDPSSWYGGLGFSVRVTR